MKGKKEQQMNISTETGRAFDEADVSELVVCSETGKALGNIDNTTAQSAGIPSGSIQMNVETLTHIKKRHAEQIKKNNLSDIAEFVFDIVSSYERIYEGTENPVLLSKNYQQHNAVAAISIIEDEGTYRVKTAFIMRDKEMKKKKLLFQRK